jgi:hypothetical protein
VHRTWLGERPDGGVGKAPLENPKMTLGPFRGDCIRLWRGASGKPLKDALPGETVLIGEGLKDALTTACAAPEYRTLCAISLSNLGAVVLPPAISTIIILAQNDPPCSVAAKTLTRAIDLLRCQGRRIKIARPPAPYKDINDLQRAHTAEARVGG